MTNVLQSAPNPMPVQVGWAVKLLWLSLAIVAVPYWWYLLPTLVGTTPNASAMSGAAIALVSLMCGAYLNLMIARRKNWARITKLIWALVSLMTTVFIWPRLGQFQSVKIAIAPALEFTALYLIFFTSGRLWFRHPASSKEV